MLAQKYKILILSAPIGSGHQLAAQAIEEAFRKYPSCQIVQGSAFDFFPHILGTIFIKSYLLVLKFFPGAYALVYRWGNSPNGSFWLRGIVNTLLAKLADNYLKKVRPDAVIATHATPVGIIDKYKHAHPRIYLAAVITDFTVHKWWLCDRVNTYFLASEDLTPKIKLQNWQKAFYYGIPVRQMFRENYNRSFLRMKFGWKKDDRVCLLMGGGEGLLPMEDIITAIVNNYTPDMKFVAVTGKNLALARKLKRLQYDLKVFGFIDNIAELMNCADYLVTKAGGLTASEALTTKIKYIIYKPLPGQEIANAEYLAGIDAAKIALSPYDVALAIRSYDRDGNIFLGAMGKPLAADYIVEAVLRDLN